MITVLKEQYLLVQGARNALLNFIETEVGDDMYKPVPAFDNRNIRYLTVHVAHAYIHWLANFAMGESREFASDDLFKTINDLRLLFAGLDSTMALFLDRFAGELDKPIHGTLSGNRQVSATPLEVFTHVITHEFHHKGQILTMSRLLGYVPVDTDIIRF